MAFTRVGAITLNIGEGPGSIGQAVDIINRFAYFVAGSYIVKINISNFSRVGALSHGFSSINQMVIDPTRGHLYIVGIAGANGYAKRISLASFTITGTLQLTTSSNIYSNLRDQFITHYLDYVYIFVLWSGALGVSNVLSTYKVSKDAWSISIGPNNLFGGVQLGSVFWEDAQRSLVFIDQIFYPYISYGVYGLSALSLSQPCSPQTIPPGVGMHPVIWGDKLFCFRNSLYAIMDIFNQPYPDMFIGVDKELWCYDLDRNAVGGSQFLRNERIIYIDSMIYPSGITVDPTNGLAYIITKDNPFKIFCVNLDTEKLVEEFQANINDEYPVGSLALDYSETAENAYIYVCDNSVPANIIKLSYPYPSGLAYITGVDCLSTIGSMEITWATVQRGVQAFRILKGLTNETLVQIGEVSGNVRSFIDINLAEETVMGYVVIQKVNDVWQTDLGLGMQIKCVWHPWIPCPPILFKGINGVSTVIITWKYLTSGCSETLLDTVTGFKIYRKREDETSYTQVGDVTKTEGQMTFVDSTIVAGHTYSYYGTSYNPFRESLQSKIVTITV